MAICGECQVLFPIIWLSDYLGREIIVYPDDRLLIQFDVSVPRRLPPDEGFGPQEGQLIAHEDRGEGLEPDLLVALPFFCLLCCVHYLYYIYFSDEV
jgi:hypothetical protein